MQKLKRDKVRNKFRKMGLKIFTAHDLQQIFGAGKRASQAFLSYNKRKGSLIRLKKGFYCFNDFKPHNFVIANEIYAPSYVSLQSALSFHQIIPETVYSITSMTTKKTNDFNINGINYSYHSIKSSEFKAYRAYKLNGSKAKIATPEKALADYLYLFYLGIFDNWNERINMTKINNQKLSQFLEDLGGKKLLKYAESKNA